MSNLEDLKKKRAELDEQIRQAEKTKAQQMREITLNTSYVKVVCASCQGLGVTHKIGNDNTDMDDWPCEDCGERGFLYARIWERKTVHSMTENQVFPA